jgi:hypothetical protein
VGGGGDGDEFRQPFDQSDQDGLQECDGVHKRARR